MSVTDGIHKALDVAKAALTGITAIDDALGHPSKTADEIIAKIRGITDIVLAAFDGSVAAEKVPEEITKLHAELDAATQKLHDDLAANDALRKKAGDAKFPPKP